MNNETKQRPLSLIVADGLDALTDGRGFDSRHQAAFALCDAAPAMRKALLECEALVRDYPSVLGQVRRALAASEGNTK